MKGNGRKKTAKCMEFTRAPIKWTRQGKPKLDEDECSFVDQIDTSECYDGLKAGSANNGIKGCGNVHRTSGNTQFVYVLLLVAHIIR